MRDPTILKKFTQEGSDSPVIFKGDTCVVRILEKFEMYGCLQVTDVVRTLGIFDMTVDGVQTGMFLAGRIEMHPSDVERIEVDGTRYVQLTFKHGDVFMTTTNTVKDEKLAYVVWIMYIKYGNLLKAMSYEDQAIIFDRMRNTCGIQFPVDHVVYETIFAHLSRSLYDLTIPYRNTDMKENFRRINLSDVSHAARSTSARVIGAYFNDGINAALTKPSTSNSLIEDLLRQ